MSELTSMMNIGKEMERKLTTIILFQAIAVRLWNPFASRLFSTFNKVFLHIHAAGFYLECGINITVNNCFCLYPFSGAPDPVLFPIRGTEDGLCKPIRIKSSSKAPFGSFMVGFRPELQTCSYCGAKRVCSIHAYLLELFRVQKEEWLGALSAVHSDFQGNPA